MKMIDKVFAEKIPATISEQFQELADAHVTKKQAEREIYTNALKAALNN